MSDKGKMLIMLGGPKKPPMDETDDDKEGGDESEMADGLPAAMEDFLAALHAKDAHAMADAFKDAMDLAGDYDKKDKPEEDEEPSEE